MLCSLKLSWYFQEGERSVENSGSCNQITNCAKKKSSDKLFSLFRILSSSYTLREKPLANQVDMKQSIVLFIFALFCLYKSSEAGPGGFPVGEHIKYIKE